MRVLRMPDERKMCVQNESEGTRHPQRFTPSLRAKSRKLDAMTCGYAAGLDYARSDRDERSERPAKVLEAIQTLLDHVKARRVTEPDGAIIAKSSAWYDSDIGFTQQTIGKILRRESKLANVY
jgi:hypothetical protein